MRDFKKYSLMLQMEELIRAGRIIRIKQRRLNKSNNKMNQIDKLEKQLNNVKVQIMMKAMVYKRNGEAQNKGMQNIYVTFKYAKGAELFKKSFDMSWFSRQQSIYCRWGVNPQTIRDKYLDG
jgi:hypothetical protein